MGTPHNPAKLSSRQRIKREGKRMGEQADYDMYENINNVGKVERTSYKCGYCGEKFGDNKVIAQNHVNTCTRRLAKQALKKKEGE